LGLEQLVRLGSVERLVAEIEVEAAVVIEVSPGGGLGGAEPEQTGGFGDVLEAAVAEVAEQ
jgi:hypothetical protein